MKHLSIDVLVEHLEMFLLFLTSIFDTKDKLYIELKKY